MIALSLTVVIVGIHFFTIEIDEACNLISVGQLFGGPYSDKDVVASPVLTSGGVYAAIHYAVLRAGLPIEADRLVSLMFSILSLLMVYEIARAQWADRGVALLGAVAFITVPGFVFMSAIAWAETAATFLLFVAAWRWTVGGSDSLAVTVTSGLLLGLAMATRLTVLVAALPAVGIWIFLYAHDVPVRRGLVLVAVALSVFVLCTAAYYGLFPQSTPASVLSNMKASTGIGYFGKFRSIVAFLIISEGFSPSVVLVISGLALALQPSPASFARLRPFCVLLWLIAATGWAAWLILAPYPHLRYLWPALPALWLCAILQLLHWFVTLASARSRLVLQGALISLWAVWFTVSLRQVALGETDTLIWQDYRQSPIVTMMPEPERLLTARNEQATFARFISQLPDDAQVVSLFSTWSYPFTILTKRKIDSLYYRSVVPAPNATFLILTPSDMTIRTLSQATRDWLRDHAKLSARTGRYSLYKIDPDAPAPPGYKLDPPGYAPHPL